MPPLKPHYRLWAALRGILYLVILAIAWPMIPRTSLFGWGATLIVTGLFGALGVRWSHAAITGRVGKRMIDALEANDQTMGSV